MGEGMKAVAAAVKELLRASGKNQSELAGHMKLTHASVSRKLSGKQTITEEEMKSVAEFLAMPWAEFTQRVGLGSGEPTKANTVGQFIGLVPIRVIDQKASASVRAGVPVDEITTLSPGRIRFDLSQYVGIRVVGSCMEPDIVDGDLVVVELGAPFESGDVVAAEVLEDGVPKIHVKRLQQRGTRWFLVQKDGESFEIEPHNVAGVIIKIERDVPRRRRR
ncbi:MAG: LexA family transcriptional regulator [Dehalococcoidia bacterium]|nr:LexA family transcriptional regulator [Dehalococcoidia bacterium]